MYIEIKKAGNLMLAEMWKEYFEGEGVPTRILPASGEAPGRIFTEYRILVPEDKKHVIEEVLRKL
jgi:hypothetical protein